MNRMIKIDSNVQRGKPVIAGTRVPVEVVVGQIAGGATTEKIMHEYVLSREQVQAALEYASDLVAGETLRMTS